jgi:hypothetical protein
MATNEIVDVYALNFSSDAYAEVLIPAVAEGFTTDSKKPQLFKLIPPFLGGFGLPPFVPKPNPMP